MNYQSTRGGQKNISFSEAVLQGLATDGGLFVPETIPVLAIEPQWAEDTYQTLAFRILKLFVTDFSDEELRACIDEAYGQKFSNHLIAPLVQVEEWSSLELFHGETAAFKDMALSILPHFMATAKRKLGKNEHTLILTATSGDTGKAALQGFKATPNMSVAVFYPTDGVSQIQKQQMVTSKGKHAYVFGIRGNFDDAQSAVKTIFDDDLIKRYLANKNIILSSANSINIGRLLPQIVYYVFAYLQAVKAKRISFGQKLNFSVPTGNFGNILAAWYAAQMGLPVGKLHCASNQNRVLTDFFETGTYSTHRPFYQTLAPSMDILISSNLERLLFELSGRDSEWLSSQMKALKKSGRYDAKRYQSAWQSIFTASSASNDEMLMHIQTVYENAGYLMDPHTAAAYGGYMRQNTDQSTQDWVIVSTASPYKFPEAILEAFGQKHDGVDAKTQLKSLYDHSGIAIPKPLVGCLEDPVLHQEVIDKNDIAHVVKHLL